MNSGDQYIIECFRLGKYRSGRRMLTLESPSMSITECYSIATDTPIPLCNNCKINHVEFRNIKLGHRLYCSKTCYNDNLTEYNKKENKNKSLKRSERITDNLMKDDLYKKAESEYINGVTSVINIAKNNDLDYVKLKKYLKIKNTFDIDKGAIDRNEQTKIKMKPITDKLDDVSFIEQKIKEKYIAQDLADLLGCSKDFVVSYLRSNDRPLKKLSVSSYEIKMRKILDDMRVSYECNVRNIMDSNKELDIYIPEHNMAIEINGIYWHSDKNHIDKTDMCEDKNIRLLHFTDYQIDDKFDIVKSIITNACNKIENRIHARNCTILQLDEIEYGSFIENNSIMPLHNNPEIMIGLYHVGELVYVAGIIGNEIINIVPLKFHIVNGAVSKLISYVRKYLGINQLRTYVNRTYFNGRSCRHSGLIFSHKKEESHISYDSSCKPTSGDDWVYRIRDSGYLCYITT